MVDVHAMVKITFYGRSSAGVWTCRGLLTIQTRISRGVKSAPSKRSNAPRPRSASRMFDHALALRM